MTGIRSILCAWSLALSAPLFGVDAPVRAYGTNANAGFNDNVDRNDPNFVKASLLVIGPDDVLYSRLGHSCLRMQCEKYGLDFCYSYESEDIPRRLLTYFSGDLTMGMFAVPTAEFLKVQRNAGRAVVQYDLTLPLDAKKTLCKILDAKVKEGFHLPYDSLKRGCAQSIIRCLSECVLPAAIVCDQWPKSCDGTIREICLDALEPYPWSQFILNAIYGIEIDQEVSKSRRIVLPADLLAYLKEARVGNARIIATEPIVLEEQKVSMSRTFATPLLVSGLMLIAAIANWWLDLKIIRIAFLSVQFLLGCFFIYMMMNARVATGWNWLVVPFNPLTAVFWKWRAHWCWLFSAALVMWVSGMLLASHRLTYAPCLVAACALAVFYARETVIFQKIKEG